MMKNRNNNWIKRNKILKKKNSNNNKINKI